MGVTGFAIVGCGVIAPRHARAIADLSDARLVAAVDQNPNAAKDFATEFGCEGGTDLDAVLARPDVDVVCVCTPNGLHARVGVPAARAGKHLVVEKPLDVDLARADQLIRACEESGVELTVICPRRFTPDGKRLRELVTGGRLGRLVLGDVVIKLYRSQAYWDSGPWRGSVELDGGTLLNQGAHGLDLLVSVMGPVASVVGQARTAVHPIESPDIELGVLTFANGAVGIVEGTTVAYPGLGERLEITGTGGSVLMDRGRISAVRLAEELGDVPAHGEALVVEPTRPASGPPSHASHREQIADLLAAVREHRRPVVTGTDGRHVIEIVTALHESSRTGRAVSLADLSA